MNRLQSVSIILITISLVLPCCTKYKEPVPFRDGLFLEYDVGSNKKITYTFQISNSNQFKITETRKRKVLDDDIEELYVGKYGKVRKSSFKPFEGKFSPVWIPVQKMSIGDTFDGGFLVARKDTWRQWQVLVIKDPRFDAEEYFEINTGYFVGSVTRTAVGTGEFVLISTNADIPTRE